MEEKAKIGIPDWQERLIAERSELLEKTLKLKKTLDDKNGLKLTCREWDLLKQQFQSMKYYLQTLTTRCVYYGLIEAGDLGISYGEI